MGAMSSLPSDFDAKLKVKVWLDRLNTMTASEEISDDEARQMAFDLDNAYNVFNRFLHNS